MDDSVEGVEVLGLEALSLSEQHGNTISSRFDTMPKEILVHIFQNIVHLNDRCAIAHSNHHFHTLALPFLYGRTSYSN